MVLLLAILLSGILSYRLLYLPQLESTGLLPGSVNRHYVLNDSGNLALSTPSMKTIPGMYVVIHHRRLYFYNGGKYYDFSFAPDGVEAILVPVDVLADIQHFTQELVEKEAARAEATAAALAEGKAEDADKMGMLSKIRGPGYPELAKTALSSIGTKNGLYAAQKREEAKAAGMTDFDRKLRDYRQLLSEAREEPERTMKDAIRDEEVRGLEGRRRAEHILAHPQSLDAAVAQPVRSNDAHVLVTTDGSGATALSAEADCVDEGGVRSCDVKKKMARMAAPFASRPVRPTPAPHGREPVYPEHAPYDLVPGLESDSDMLARPALQLRMRMTDGARRTFVLRNEADAVRPAVPTPSTCLTYYDRRFIMAECSHSPAQIFSLEDAPDVIGRLHRGHPIAEPEPMIMGIKDKLEDGDPLKHLLSKSSSGLVRDFLYGRKKHPRHHSESETTEDEKIHVPEIHVPADGRPDGPFHRPPHRKGRPEDVHFPEWRNPLPVLRPGNERPRLARPAAHPPAPLWKIT